MRTAYRSERRWTTARALTEPHAVFYWVAPLSSVILDPQSSKSHEGCVAVFSLWLYVVCVPLRKGTQEGLLYSFPGGESCILLLPHSDRWREFLSLPMRGTGVGKSGPVPQYFKCTEGIIYTLNPDKVLTVCILEDSDDGINPRESEVENQPTWPESSHHIPMHHEMDGSSPREAFLPKLWNHPLPWTLPRSWHSCLLSNSLSTDTLSFNPFLPTDRVYCPSLRNS